MEDNINISSTLATLSLSLAQLSPSLFFITVIINTIYFPTLVLYATRNLQPARSIPVRMWLLTMTPLSLHRCQEQIRPLSPPRKVGQDISGKSAQIEVQMSGSMYNSGMALSGD